MMVPRSSLKVPCVVCKVPGKRNSICVFDGSSSSVPDRNSADAAPWTKTAMVSRYAKAQLLMTFLARRAMLKASVQKRFEACINLRVDKSFAPSLSSLSSDYND